ncbi:MAG TPA: hypothetical protein VIH55_02385 [Acidimicrobiia bacterium]
MPARLLIASLALLVVATACGGDGGAEDEDTTVTEAPDAGSDTTTTTVPADTDATIGGDGSITTVCLEATQAMAAAMSSYSTGLAGAAGGSLDDESLQQAADQLEAMAAAAPEEIKDDLEVIAAELGEFYATLAEIGYEQGGTPTAEQIAALSALAEVVDQEAIEEASDNIEAWFDSNC